MTRTWRCRKTTKGIRCDQLNLRTKVKCSRPGCTGRRPKSKRPSHMNVLDIPYEVWVAKFGERCGICGAKPKPGKRLQREHGHSGEGVMRGLACFPCNRKLGNKDLAWLRAAVAYLERAEAGDFTTERAA